MAEPGTEGKPPFWVIANTFLAASLLLILYAATAKASVSAWALFAVELLIGLAALVVGALLGFLFGIPRMPQRSDSAGTTGFAARAFYEPSNNLEQVSDWLTKILVGATLVQLKELREFVSIAGLRVMQGTGGAATSIVTQMTMIAFGVLGFLGGFLWTRVYCGAIQVRADKHAFDLVKDEVKAEVKAEVDAVKEEVKENLQQTRAQSEQVVAVAGRLLQSSAPDVAPSAGAGPVPLELELEAKIDEFKRKPAAWDSDPVFELFGAGAASANGATLTCTVETVVDGESLILTLRVNSEAPLDVPVTFLLHPTMSKSVHVVVPRNNSASVTFYSEGWFHAAAIWDDTVLVLDLRTVPGIPEWFKRA